MKCASTRISTVTGMIMHQSDHQLRNQNRAGGDRRDFEPPQNIRFAVHHGAHARAEKSGAQNADDQHHGDDLHDGAALLGMHHESEDKKENQREKIIEKQHRAIAHGEAQIRPDLCDIGSHVNPSAAFPSAR